MPEKTYTEITLQFDPKTLETIKAQAKAGSPRPLSATQAVEIAVSTYVRDATAVKLHEPERREIESRTGATTPIRSSKDILRAFERVQGGQNCLTIEMDPGVETTMRDVAHGLGLGLSEFVKQVVESSFTEGYLYTCDLKPLFFKVSEWKSLTELLENARIPSGAALISIIREALRAARATEGAQSPSSVTHASVE